MRARSTTSVRRNRATGPAGVPTTPAIQFPPMGSHNPQISRIGALLPVTHRHLPGLSGSGLFFESPRRFPLQAVVAAGRSVWAMAGGVPFPKRDASKFLLSRDEFGDQAAQDNTKRFEVVPHGLNYGANDDRTAEVF